MPLWASILIPLLTGLVAVGGAVLGTYATGRLERERERRTLLAETAKPFAEKIGGATDSLLYALALDAKMQNWREAVAQPLANAENLTGEASVPLAPVRLFFGSRAGGAGEQALLELRSATELLRQAVASKDPTEALTTARDACDRSRQAQAIFYHEADRAISKARIGSPDGT
jgi:hypothetical protein